MDRRNFIRTGSLAVLGSVIAPSFAAPLGNKSNDKATLSEAMNHFGVTESDLRKVLSTALEKGGDYADLFFEHTFSNYVGLQDRAVNRCTSNIDFGMGVRVISGDQSGYAYVEDLRSKK